MGKEQDNQSIDDLFARKLGKMSLPPSADGFERLQKRMAQQTGTPIRVVLWHKPTVQRYIAVAACFLVICLFGWIYWSSDSVPVGASVSIHRAPRSQRTLQNSNQTITNEQIATVVTKKSHKLESFNLPKEHHLVDNVFKPIVPSATNRVASTATNVQPIKNAPTLTELATIAPVITPQTSQSPENAAKSLPQAERVLVVTIEEPAILAVAQQEKSELDEKPVVITTEKLVKDVKASNLWQKVKQLKQGELLAKSDNDNAADDQGLLSRAYIGLKHSIEKSKTTRQ